VRRHGLPAGQRRAIAGGSAAARATEGAGEGRQSRSSEYGNDGDRQRCAKAGVRLPRAQGRGWRPHAQGRPAAEPAAMGGWPGQGGTVVTRGGR
jgi:hypothetical protein